MKLGDQVKYTDDDSNEILATIQAKTSDGDVIISLPGGNTIKVLSADINTKLSDELDI